MYMIILSLGLWVLGANAVNQVPPISSTICKNASKDGIIEFNCWGYAECVNQVLVIHPCEGDTFLDRNTMTCVPSGSNGIECGNHTPCSGDPDGLYPDISVACSSFYRCEGGVHLGRFYCPATLVFNDATQSCDYKTNVAPPCGTFQNAIV